MTGRAGLRSKLLLAVGATLFALSAIEIACRLCEGESWWEQIASEQTESQKIDYESNRHHLRDEDFTTPRPAGTGRVLVLGDSFTFGLGVRDRRDTFVELLEARLNANPPDPAPPSATRYELLNGGMPALLTDAWVKLFDEMSPLFQPDLVVAVFFLRDGSELGFTRNFFGPMHERMEQWRTGSALARASAAWRLFQGRRLALSMSREYVDAFRRSYLGSAEETREWRAAQRRLVTLRDRCAKARVGFALVVFPALFEFGPAYPFQPICDEIARFGAEKGFATFSLLPALRNEVASALWVSPGDQHPNERCHRIVADALEPQLREWIRTPPIRTGGR
jgi:hypothetical protein